MEHMTTNDDSFIYLFVCLALWEYDILLDKVCGLTRVRRLLVPTREMEAQLNKFSMWNAFVTCLFNVKSHVEYSVF